ncbi:hypothetical protein BC940DRAFT_32963 [Gongronella butleri]|nr:hypothetical protein BC940DRAFT_32963 [Gongronella butleri]
MNVSELCLTSPSAIKLPPLPLPPSHDIANDYLPSPIKSDSSSNTSSASGLTPGHLQPLQHPPPSLYTTQAGQQHYQQQPQLPPPPTAHHRLLPPAQSPQDGTVAAELQLLIDKCQLLCERLQHDNQSSLPPSLSAGDASSSPIHMAHDLLHGLRQLHQKEQEEIDANEMEYELIRQSRSWKENRRPKYRRRSKKSTVGQQCHSCHTSETPEWRRGPDGARTLCNACGLRKNVFSHFFSLVL